MGGVKGEGRRFIDHPRNLLRRPPAVREEQCRALLINDLSKFVDKPRPPGTVDHLLTRIRRKGHRDVVFLCLFGLNKGYGPFLKNAVLADPGFPESTHECSHPFHRIDRGRERDALEIAAKRNQPVHCSDKVRAAFAAHDRMDLVENDRLNAQEHAAAGPGSEQQVQRLGGGDQDLRRPAEHSPPFFARSVPAPGENGDGREWRAGAVKGLTQFSQRLQQVSLDVVIQCFER